VNIVLLGGIVGFSAISTQLLANLDFNLNFQLDSTKCFVTGTVTNNTGSDIGANSILLFTDSSYNARTALPTKFYAGTDNATDDVSQLFQFNGANLILLGNLEDGKIATINCFYYTN